MLESQEEVTERELSDLDWKVSFSFSPVDLCSSKT